MSAVSAAVTAVFCAVFAYYYAALPISLNVEAGAPVTGTGFAHAALKTTEDGAEYFLGNIPIKHTALCEQERRYVVPCGEPFGVKVLSDKAGLEAGDVIISVNGREVFTNDELTDAITHSNGSADIVFRRGESEKCVSVTPATIDGAAKIGAWVRDSAAGIGTLTFIDPETGDFGGLGHAVSDADTGCPVPLKEGQITSAEIYDVVKGEKGSAGELCGAVLAGKEIGEVRENSPTGIFGEYRGGFDGEEMPVAFRQEVKTGAAVLLTTVDGTEPREYSIEIERINLPDLMGSKGMLIKITDPELIEKTGGIVRGMSGSPIIQNGRLAGAVTHVLVSDPTRGYAVFAESMLSDSN